MREPPDSVAAGTIKTTMECLDRGDGWRAAEGMEAKTKKKGS